MHAAVHNTGAAKVYACRLDGCEKRYKQLGNLKSHMNKFHQETLRALTERLDRMGEEKCENEGEERELLRYFLGLYRNANKGIKGRNVAPPPSSSSAASAASGGWDTSPSCVGSLGEEEGGILALGTRMIN